MAAKTLIFIPTYNERENVLNICARILALELDAHILFIDDNSPDGTGQILDGLASVHSNVAVVHRPGKLGIGAAHQDGIRYAYEHDGPGDPHRSGPNQGNSRRPGGSRGRRSFSVRARRQRQLAARFGAEVQPRCGRVEGASALSS